MYNAAFNRVSSQQPVDYSSYGSAIQGLQAKAGGSFNQNFLAGSEQAGAAVEGGNLQMLRQVDPWSFYRGSAADNLAKQVPGGENDPTSIYRSKLEQMMNGEFGPEDPSYKWRYDQGQQAVERSLAAKGLLNSGNAAIELQQYGQGAASTEYQAQFERTLQALAGVEDQYNSSQQRLMQLAGVNNASAGMNQQQNSLEAQQAQGYQQGMAAAANKPTNPYAGYSFG
jgi:hypothetical protein